MTDARINELRQRIDEKIAYGVKCTRDMNELARLEDAARSPFERIVRRWGGYALVATFAALFYAPVVIAAYRGAKSFFVGG